MRDRILSTADAAEAFHVPVRTIEDWAHRGGLQNAGAEGYYWERDVAEVEWRTRRKPRLLRLVEAAAS